MMKSKPEGGGVLLVKILYMSPQSCNYSTPADRDATSGSTGARNISLHYLVIMDN
jgi:hypothetical protein